MPIHESAKLGKNVRVQLPEMVNIYGCVIGDYTRIGPFVEIQRGVAIGARCKIQSHSFLCDGVTVEDDVFIGHGVMFTNDLYPRATDDSGHLLGPENWVLRPTLIRQGASIGSGATILPVTIGRFSLVAAGAVVTRSVPDFQIVAGCPARAVGDVREKRSQP